MRDGFHQAQFTSDSDDGVVRCPYCKHEYQPEAENYSEDTRQDECSECGKKFWLYQDFTVTHVVKPDCELNGQPHKWDGVHGRPGYESCDVCDKWRHVGASAPGEPRE